VYVETERFSGRAVTDICSPPDRKCTRGLVRVSVSRVKRLVRVVLLRT